MFLYCKQIFLKKLNNIYLKKLHKPEHKKKKTKSEVVMPKDDCTFKVNENRLPRAQFCFLKKKKGNR